MGESFDHCPPGWIRQSRKRCAQFIHNRMVVDYRTMSSMNFAEETPDEGAVFVPRKLTLRRNVGTDLGKPMIRGIGRP